MKLSAQILQEFPVPDRERTEQLLNAELERNKRKIIVLDDDPTGVQTVHNVSVYTDWTEESIRQGMKEERSLFYILTNSRGFTEEQTVRAHREIAERVCRISRELNQPYLLISRSDSTLRGHYPLETELLRETIEAESTQKIDGEILCPFFREGGRFTIHHVHYVRYGEELVPAGETEFAGDKTFGYRSSDLKDYIEEKTAGRYPAEDVTAIDIESLRRMDLDGIEKALMDCTGFGKIVVDAVDYCDLEVFAIALLRAVARGKNFLFRSAAALVKVLGGIPDRPLLERREMVQAENRQGGIIVVGSHTKKTTEQLMRLLELENTVGIEFQSDLVLEGEERFRQEQDRVLARCEEAIRQGKTAVAYTNRRLLVVEQDTGEKALLRSVRISDAVQSFVGRLSVTPAFVIAKGGITSSDVGTKALQVKRAEVLGQICPGIPVWKTGPESRFPGIPYVIFPGNVGEADTLKEAAGILMNGREKR